jgi:hypothetical protein
MPDFEEINNNFPYDIHKLSAERLNKLNVYRQKEQAKNDNITISINFTLTNTFWGNSWSCNEILSLTKGKSLKTSVNVQNSNSLSEIWDCKVIYFNNEDEHNIYLKSLDSEVIIQIYNNKFSCTCSDSHTLSGYVSEKQKVIS